VVRVIPSAARDLLFASVQRKQQIPRGEFALGMTVGVSYRKLSSTPRSPARCEMTIDPMAHATAPAALLLLRGVFLDQLVELRVAMQAIQIRVNCSELCRKVVGEHGGE